MERSQKILELMADNKHKDKGIIKWNYDKIINLELLEYDSYRFFKTFLSIRTNKTTEQTKIMDEMFKDSKLFIVSKEIKHLLLLTKPSPIKEELKTPFNELFIDFDYYDEKDEYRIFGLNIIYQSKETIQEINEEAKKTIGRDIFPPSHNNNAIHVSTYCFSKEINDWSPCDIIINLKTGKIIPKLKTVEGEKSKKTHKEFYKLSKKISKVVKDFVLNVLLFLNEPRVITYITQPNNVARIKKGKIPVPSLIKTKIEFGLKQHIENVYYNGLSSSKLGFSFWVRGHWRLFSSPRFVNKVGTKIWIAPHLVGDGITPPQTFHIV